MSISANPKLVIQTGSLCASGDASIFSGTGGPEGYDGVAQLWWDSLEDMARAEPKAAAEAGRLLLEDERKFIDLPNSPLWWGEEKVIF